MEYRVIVAAVIYKDHKVLLGRKQPGVGPFPNSWHLPGGGVKLGSETLLEAIKREVLEETQIKLKNIRRCAFDEGDEPNKHGILTHYIFLVFTADFASGKATPGDDLAKLSWFTKEELKNLPLSIYTKRIFKKLTLL